MIWIVEDSHYVANAMKWYIDKNVGNSQIIPDGAEVIKLLGAGVSPTMIVLDLELNGTSGTEIIKFLIETGSQIPVVLVTANIHTLPPEYKEFPCAIFEKPPSFPKMADAIRENVLDAMRRRRGLPFLVRLLAVSGDFFAENKKTIALILSLLAAILGAVATWLGLAPKG